MQMALGGPCERVVWLPKGCDPQVESRCSRELDSMTAEQRYSGRNSWALTWGSEGKEAERGTGNGLNLLKPQISSPVTTSSNKATQSNLPKQHCQVGTKYSDMGLWRHSHATREAPHADTYLTHNVSYVNNTQAIAPSKVNSIYFYLAQFISKYFFSIQLV